MATGFANDVDARAGTSLPRPGSAALMRTAPLAAPSAAIVAAVLGALLIARRPLTSFEAIAIERADSPFRELADWAIQNNPGQAGYLALLHSVVGRSDAEWAVRAPSVVAAALSCLLAYGFGALLISRLAGAVAAFALALNGGVVVTSQQVRPVTLAVFFVLLATLVLALALTRSDWWWFAYVPACALLAFSHPIAVSVLAAHAVAVAVALVTGGRSRIRAVAAFALAAVAAAPLALAAAVDRAESREGWSGLALTDLGDGLARAVGWNPALVLLAAAGCIALAIGVLPRSEPWKAALVIGLIAAPVLAVVVTGAFAPVHPEWALVVIAPGLAIAAGAAVAWARIRSVALAAAAVFVPLALVGLLDWYGGSPAEDWRSGIRAAKRAAGHRGPIVVLPERGRAVAAYYAPQARLVRAGRGDTFWVLVADTDTPASIESVRAVVQTPRYALLSQVPAGDGLLLQRWVRP